MINYWGIASVLQVAQFVLIWNSIKAVMNGHVHIWIFLIFRFEQTFVTTAGELNISTYNTTTSYIQACICRCTKKSTVIISDHCNQTCWHTMYQTGYTWWRTGQSLLTAASGQMKLTMRTVDKKYPRWNIFLGLCFLCAETRLQLECWSALIEQIFGCALFVFFC